MPRFRLSLLSVGSVGALLVALVLPLPAREDPKVPAGAPDFNRDVRPILAARCFKCLGPDVAAR
jgi:hypothetical protein